MKITNILLLLIITNSLCWGKNIKSIKNEEKLDQETQESYKKAIFHLFYFDKGKILIENQLIKNPLNIYIINKNLEIFNKHHKDLSNDVVIKKNFNELMQIFQLHNHSKGEIIESIEEIYKNHYNKIEGILSDYNAEKKGPWENMDDISLGLFRIKLYKGVFLEQFPKEELCFLYFLFIFSLCY
jgi:hypothetical protein